MSDSPAKIVVSLVITEQNQGLSLQLLIDPQPVVGQPLPLSAQVGFVAMATCKDVLEKMKKDSGQESAPANPGDFGLEVAP